MRPPNVWPILILVSIVAVIALMAILLPQMAYNSDYEGGNISGVNQNTTNLTSVVSEEGATGFYAVAIILGILTVGAILYTMYR